MKNLFLAVLFFLSFNLFGQENKPTDILMKHNGENLKVYVQSVTESSITFVYPNENVQNIIAKNGVREILFVSGRTQKITEKILVIGEDDWEKVIITTNPADVVGLSRKGEIKSKSSSAWNFKSTKGVAEKADKKLKKEAAEMKCHIILILQQTTEGNSLFQSAESYRSGVCYTYE